MVIQGCRWRMVMVSGLVLAPAACGNAIYAVEVNSAARRLEEARKLGAEELAPYDYYYAEEHLKKARQEAAEADYGDAARLASVAEERAGRAAALARAARRGGAR